MYLHHSSATLNKHTYTCAFTWARCGATFFKVSISYDWTSVYSTCKHTFLHKEVDTTPPQQLLQTTTLEVTHSGTQVYFSVTAANISVTD